MDFGLYIKFYKSAGGKQNMWIEKEGIDGVRHEINNIEDASNIILEYIKSIPSMCQ